MSLKDTLSNVWEPSQQTTKKSKKKNETNKESYTEPAELTALKTKSHKATLMKPIQEMEKRTYEIEKRKVELEREAGGLLEFQMAEFLFVGYLEKMNIDLLSFMKKIRPIIKNLCNENKPEEIEKRVNKEITLILKSISTAESKELKKWKRGEK